MTHSAIERLGWERFSAIAREAGQTLPVEQTIAWEAFDRAVAGRDPWGRLAYIVDGKPRALIGLTRMKVRAFDYLWAKHGPVWLGQEPKAQEESDLRTTLVAYLRRRDSRVIFVRMHALHAAPDCRELLQTMTYDRTVILNLDVESDEALLESFKKRGRRDVRKALRNGELVFADETARAEEVFGELYEILLETGERDGFRAAPKSTYLRMIESLRPHNIRLNVARTTEGKALAWSIVAVWEEGAEMYYAGSSAEGRQSGAADALLYKAACWLRAEGVKVFDLMGVDSERAPQLAGVRLFKTKFDDPVEVAGAWDVAVRPAAYNILVYALAAKRTLTSKGPALAKSAASRAAGVASQAPRALEGAKNLAAAVIRAERH